MEIERPRRDPLYLVTETVQGRTVCINDLNYATNVKDASNNCTSTALSEVLNFVGNSADWARNKVKPAPGVDTCVKAYYSEAEKRVLLHTGSITFERRKGEDHDKYGYKHWR